MCSIVGSRDTEKLIELATLNEYRGTVNWSLTGIDLTNYSVRFLLRFEGERDDQLIRDVGETHKENDGQIYYVVHQQAPTSRVTESIHPAEMYIDNQLALLWHNGLIKPEGIKQMQTVLDIDEQWDTQLLLHYIVLEQPLEDILGSFACLYCDGNRLYALRNSIAPLFIDHDCNLSSTKFEGSTELISNRIYEINFIGEAPTVLTEIHNFENIEAPYFIVE